jgi:hypothetical protein
MSYVICSLLVFAFWHWLYESMLAPSCRQVLRLELQALQAELVSLKGRSGDSPSDQAFDVLSESLSTLSVFLDRLDFVTLAAVEIEIRRDPALRELAESRAALFQSSGAGALRDLRMRSLRLAVRAVVVNSGGWCAFVIPLALVRLGMHGIRGLVAAALLLSRSDLGRVAPAASLAALRYP